MHKGQGLLPNAPGNLSSCWAMPGHSTTLEWCNERQWAPIDSRIGVHAQTAVFMTLFVLMTDGAASSILAPCTRLWPPPTRAPTMQPSTALLVSNLPVLPRVACHPILSA